MGRLKGGKNSNPVPIDVRFWSKVSVANPSECWNWNAFIHPSGYGTFRLNGKEALSHRMSWILSFGQIPDGLCVCHKCDNRICCNPSHLFLGTYKDNANDRDRKGRTKIPNNAGDNHGMSKLTEDDVKRILHLHAEGYSNREIANIVGKVVQTTIYGIVTRRSWKHVRAS